MDEVYLKLLRKEFESFCFFFIPNNFSLSYKLNCHSSTKKINYNIKNFKIS